MDQPKTLFLDIETTGLVPKMMVNGKRPGTQRKETVPYETGFALYPNVVSMAWKIDDEKTHYMVLNQGKNIIPQEAINIHGITNQIANASPFNFLQAINKFIVDSFECDIVVGHNIYYDTSIIKANVLKEVHAGNLTQEHFDVIVDRLHKDKRIDTMRRTIKMMGKWPTLQELHMKIFNRGFDAHNAKNDVEALARCYEWLARKGIIPTLEQLREKARERVNE